MDETFIQLYSIVCRVSCIIRCYSFFAFEKTQKLFFSYWKCSSLSNYQIKFLILQFYLKKISLNNTLRECKEIWEKTNKWRPYFTCEWFLTSITVEIPVLLTHSIFKWKIENCERNSYFCTNKKKKMKNFPFIYFAGNISKQNQIKIISHL